MRSNANTAFARAELVNLFSKSGYGTDLIEMFSLSEKNLIYSVPLYGVDPTRDGLHEALQTGAREPVPSVEVECRSPIARLASANISCEGENVVELITSVTCRQYCQTTSVLGKDSSYFLRLPLSHEFVKCQKRT